MPTTFVFDTNYIRTFSQNDFLSGKVPQGLATQIKKIASRGDSIAIFETVRLEVNAWFSKAIEQRETELNQAVIKLKESGYKIDSSEAIVQPEIDFFELLKTIEDSCFLLLPDIDDYREAERRTSFRLPPHPKNMEHEEMRDRLIWCQIISYAKKSAHGVVLVSGDTIFKNGAATDEARTYSIECVADIELDQRIGVRSPHIVEIITMLESFDTQLQERGVVLNAHTIESLEELRKLNEVDGTVTMKFTILSHGSGLPERCTATLSALGVEAFFIQIDIDPLLSFRRKVSSEANQELARWSQVSQRVKELRDLRSILEH